MIFILFSFLPLPLYFTVIPTNIIITIIIWFFYYFLSSPLLYAHILDFHFPLLISPSTTLLSPPLLPSLLSLTSFVDSASYLDTSFGLCILNTIILFSCSYFSSQISLPLLHHPISSLPIIMYFTLFGLSCIFPRCILLILFLSFRSYCFSINS